MSTEFLKPSYCRIDVHQHIVPDVFRRLLNSVGITGGAGEEFAAWDEQTTLGVMDEHGIQTSVVSYVLSGIDIKDFDFFRKLCRECNDYTAELIAKYPGRFGGFALLPLPDVEGALDEIRYALDVLKLDGVGMHSNMGGVYPGDQRFEPVFEDLNRRNAVVHLHPTDVPGGRDFRPQWPPYIVEFMFETTRAAANLVYSGTMERHPNVSIILSHAGGAIPYLAWRLWTGEFVIPGLGERAPAGVLEYLKRFYYDTAMAANPGAFASLTELVDPSRILFGTDYPYMPDYAIGEFTRQTAEYPDFDTQDRASIERENALELFPRLKKKP
ncbi:MAG: amidohydrolase [Candidatus Lindowbacteria bacterium]|nr:amidohydrolase [Candidatus Lindowbacteria bacterium]